jgi:lipoprotein-anchoring transpeptidase ErfK/SrfK
MTRAAVRAVALTATAGFAFATPAHAAAPRVPASQPLVVLLGDHVARTSPNPHGHRIESVSARRPLTRVQTVLPVLGSATDGGKPWVRVRLPGRPNGHSGWIPAARTRSTSTPWRIAVKVSARRVIVYRKGRVVRRFSAVVGKASTPTPRGWFFVEEALSLSSRDAGGPYALATSARSNVLQEFEGGPGQIALHGTASLSGALGSAASHGCVRLNTRAITWLARRMGAGVPLDVVR